MRDEHEFEDFVVARGSALLRTAVLLCAGSRHDAEDVVQTALEKAYRHWSRVEGDPEPYVRRILVNVTISRARRWKLLREVHMAQPPEPLVSAADDGVVLRDLLVRELRRLPPRQRAVLVLRDVLQWKAAEVGAAVGASTAAVNSLLQRARAQLDAVGPKEDDSVAAPEDPETQDLLGRYIAAFEAYDIDKLVELFTADAVWEMPPFDGWYVGPEAIGSLSRDKCPAERAGDMRLLSTTANGQPAAAMYLINRETGVHEPFQLHVLAVSPNGVTHVVAFLDTTLFEKFGLPASL